MMPDLTKNKGPVMFLTRSFSFRRFLVTAKTMHMEVYVKIVSISTDLDWMQVAVTLQRV